MGIRSRPEHASLSNGGRDKAGFWKNFWNMRLPVEGLISAGVVVRDHKGAVIAAMSVKRASEMDVDFIVAFAVLATIQFVLDMGLHHIILEGDSLVIVRALQSSWAFMASFGHFVEQAKSLLARFRSWGVKHVKREGNSVAYCLARMAIAMEGFSVCIEGVPLSLRSLVKREASF
ncbi:uncharacterized protein LOC114312721 [Camellia sinensis]|uniref:uncharacterized protein LOC114312721 n=1 Tax=Camellia sinensis TaxID=4442 RepID=UPI001035F0CA|nr:uncharacterized protein LOC114312721 [Camellia sinensis]